MQTWPAHDQDAPLSWSIPCTSPAQPPHVPDPEDMTAIPHQIRSLTEQEGALVGGRVRVLVLGDRVAVVLPPGDTLVFTREEATQLADTLDRARAHVPDRRRP